MPRGENMALGDKKSAGEAKNLQVHRRSVPVSA
jgi:hypothetical protein